MSEPASGKLSPRLLLDLVELLQAARARGSDPTAAQTALEEVRSRHGGARIDLLWEAESYSGAHHYDVLLHTADGAVSISWNPNDGCPWPMRGVQRWSESCVARIDGAVIDVGTAFAAADFWWGELHVGPRLVQRYVLERADLGADIEVTDEDLAEAMREFRQRRRLFSAEQAFVWMRDHGITQGQLEEHLRIEVRGRRIRERVAASAADGPPAVYFERHSASFEQLRLACVHASDRAEAERLVQDLRSGTRSLWTIAQERFIATGREYVRLVSMYHRDIDAAHSALRDAPAGRVLDPLPSGDGWDVVWVLARIAPRFDAETRLEITRRLFEQWLAEQTARVRVEWFWGAAEPAPLPSSAAPMMGE
jgi:putative peptide maturation system protein